MNDSNKRICIHDVMVEAQCLMSEDGENPEYDRALVELVSYLIGVSPQDYYEDVADLIDQAPYVAVLSLELEKEKI